MAKKTPEVVEFDEAQFLTIEGKCVQVFHIDPYSTESESLAKMKELMEEKTLLKTEFITRFIYRTQDGFLKKK
jgi:hypothetical protein